jgi:hypothetical protein
MIKLELSIEEVNFILAVIGDLPTKKGAWELLKRIKEQADPQVLEPEAETPPAAE